MNNLRKFNNEAEYSAATLNYPAVSWVVSGDTVHYDKTSGETPTSAPAVKVAFTTDSCVTDPMTLSSDGGILDIVSAITVNGVPFEPLDSNMYLTVSTNTDYLIEYELMDDATDMGYQFSYVATPMGCSSSILFYDILFPEQVTKIDSLNYYGVGSLIMLSETPPSVSSMEMSGWHEPIYVPDASVNAYKNAGTWKSAANYIFPISEYSGNLPV